LYLNGNALNGTIPSTMVHLTNLNEVFLAQNRLTGLVPPLPFSQYNGSTNGGCGFDAPDECGRGSGCNHFRCPLPHGAKSYPCYIHCK
jgi:hypothetical protein